MKSKTSDYKPRTLSRIDFRKSENNVMIGSKITFRGIKKICMSTSPQKVEDVKQLVFYQNPYDDNKNSKKKFKVDGNQIVHDVGLNTTSTSTEISNSVSSSSSSSFPSSSSLASSFSAKNKVETSNHTSSNIKQDNIGAGKKSNINKIEINPVESNITSPSLNLPSFNTRTTPSFDPSETFIEEIVNSKISGYSSRGKSQLFKVEQKFTPPAVPTTTPVNVKVERNTQGTLFNFNDEKISPLLGTVNNTLPSQVTKNVGGNSSGKWNGLTATAQVTKVHMTIKDPVVVVGVIQPNHYNFDDVSRTKTVSKFPKTKTFQKYQKNKHESESDDDHSIKYPERTSHTTGMTSLKIIPNQNDDGMKNKNTIPDADIDKTLGDSTLKRRKSRIECESSSSDEDGTNNNGQNSETTKLIPNVVVDHNQGGANHVDVIVVSSSNSQDSLKISEQNIISNGENQDQDKTTFNLPNTTVIPVVDTTPPITKYSEEKIMTTVSQIPTSSSSSSSCENNSNILPSCCCQTSSSSKTVVRTNLSSTHTHTCENETVVGMTSSCQQHLKTHLLSCPCPHSNNQTSVMIFKDHPTECIFGRHGHGFHRCWTTTCNYNNHQHQHCIGGRKHKLECDECCLCSEYCPVCTTSRNTMTTTMGNHNTMSCHLNKHRTADDTQDVPPIVTTTTTTPVPENLEQQQQFVLIETTVGGGDFVKEKVMDDNRKLTKTSQTQTNEEQSRVEPQRTTTMTEVCIKEIPIIVKSGGGVVTLSNVNSSTTRPTISNSNSKGCFTGGSVPNQKNIAEASTQIDTSDFLWSSPLETSSKIIPTVGNDQNQDQSLVNLGVQGPVPVPNSAVLRPSVFTAAATVQRPPQFLQPGPGSLSFSSLSKSIGMSSRVDQQSASALIGNKQQLNPFQSSIRPQFVFPQQPSQSSQLPNVGTHQQQQQHQSLVDLGIQGARMSNNVFMPAAVQGASQFTPPAPGSSFRFRPQSIGSTLNPRQVQNSTIVYGSQQLNTPIRRSFVSSAPNQLFVKSPRFVTHQDQYQTMTNLGVQGQGRVGINLESGLLRTNVAQGSSQFSNPTNNNMRLFRPFAPSISSSRPFFPVSHPSPYNTYPSQSLSGNHGLNLFQSQSSRQIPISQPSFNSENYYLVDPHQQTQQIQQQLFHKQIDGSPQHMIPSTFVQKVHPVTEQQQQQTLPVPIYQKQGQLVWAYQPGYEQQGQPVPPYQQQGQPVPPYQQQGQPVPPYQQQGQPVPPYQQQGQTVPLYQQEGQLVPLYPYMVQPDGRYQQIMYQEQQPQEYPSLSSGAHGLRQNTTNVPSSQSYIHPHIFGSEQSLQNNSRSWMPHSASHTNFGREIPTADEYEQFNPQQGCKNSSSNDTRRVIPEIVTTLVNQPEVSIPAAIQNDPSKPSSNLSTNFGNFSKLSNYDNVPETCSNSSVVVDLPEKNTYFQKIVKINPSEIIVPVSTTTMTKPPSSVSIKIEPGTQGVPNPIGIIPISISNNVQSSSFDDDSLSIIYEKIIPISGISSQQQIQSSSSSSSRSTTTKFKSPENLNLSYIGISRLCKYCRNSFEDEDEYDCHICSID